MQTSDLTIEVRNSSLARVGQILPYEIVKFQAVLRLRNVGSWSIVLPNGHRLIDDLRAPGAGIIVTGPTGVILSGPMTSSTFTASVEHPDGDWEIKGVDDSVILGERLAYPDPGVADVSAQTLEFDAQTGAAETLIYHYINTNIGPSAPAARKISNLTLGADLGRGGTASASARFDRLGELISPLAEAAGLGFDITQVGSNLNFEVFQPTDRSAYVRMDIENNQLTKSEYTYATPVTTRAIIAGQGEGINRSFLEATSTESLTSEAAWGRRIERFIDSRDGGTDADLSQAGTEELAKNGTTITKVSVSPTDDTTMRYGIDWNLGDKVSVVVADQTLSTTVTEVGIQMSASGVVVTATIGEPTGFTFEAKVSQKQVQTESRVSALERYIGSGTGSERQVAYVKNQTGGTLTRGIVVYPSGSTGANNLVSKSQANAELTSSKTFGVMDQDLANGEHGYVVTFGLLENIDTSGLTEGAAVYLSPTTAGSWTSTKPSAPNHVVLVGFCIRTHATTGRLFVKIQNGFELDELHDVAIGTKADNNLLAYDSASGTWTNQTAAQAGVATTADLSGYATTAALNLKAPLASPTFTGTVTSGGAVVVGAASTFTNPGGGAVLDLKSTTANTNAYIAFYKGGSSTRTGYMGQASGTANTIVLNDDSATGASFSVGTDGQARIWSLDIYNRTYASNPTVCVTTAGTLGRVTSATKYKLEIEEKDTDGEKILELSPKTWLDKAQYEKNQRFLTLLANGEDVSEFEGYTEDWVQPRVAGLIAEDLIAAGLSEYVFYGEPDENGNREVEGIQYDRLWVELLPVVKTQQSEITQLKEMVALLTDRVIALEKE